MEKKIDKMTSNEMYIKGLDNMRNQVSTDIFS